MQFGERRRAPFLNFFRANARELLNLDSGVSDKQVEEVVQLLLSLQFAFNFLTKKFVS